MSLIFASAAAETVRLLPPTSIKRGAENHLAPVDAGAAGSQIASDRHPCEVLDTHRNPAAGGDD